MEYRLFVRNFSPETDAAHLEGLFSSVGDVRKISLENLTKNGVIRRVAYVEMASAEEMRNCIDRFHGMQEDGCTLTVTEDKPHTPDPNFRAKIIEARKAKKKAALLNSKQRATKHLRPL